jgi:hypothetical protein
MNIVVVVFRNKAQMSLHLVAVHREPRVHETGGFVGTFWGARQVLALESHVQRCDLRMRESERAEHPWQGFVHLPDLGASKVLVWSSQSENSGACPPSGINYRSGYSWQRRPG